MHFIENAFFPWSTRPSCVSPEVVIWIDYLTRTVDIRWLVPGGRVRDLGPTFIELKPVTGAGACSKTNEFVPAVTDTCHFKRCGTVNYE
jgi:hypothetical protein